MWGMRRGQRLRGLVSASLRVTAATGLLLLLAGIAAGDENKRALDLEGMTYVSSHGAFNELVLDAERANIKPAEDLALLEGVHVILASFVAGPRGRGGLDMTCDTGTVYLGSGDFVAEGDVRGTTGDGRRFRTTRLRYNHEKGLVVTDVPVSIRDRAGTYRGGGFQYWVRENRFKLTGGASVVAQ